MKCHLWIPVVCCVCFLCFCKAKAEDLQLSVKKEENCYSIEIVSDETVVWHSPGEGLWSIATDWQDRWPAKWRHASPMKVERIEDWTILRGELELPEGKWKLADSYRLEDGYIKCIRRFIWEGENTLERCTLSVRYFTGATGSGVLMPGIVYYGNPSGARSGRVPVYEGKSGEESIFEEHRFPMPFVSLEGEIKSELRGVAMHSLPSPVPYGNLPDQWWSMGVIAHEDSTEFTLLSGPCASNRKRSVIKAVQPGFVPYDNAYLNIEPGTIIEKTFYLEAYPVEAKGSGFRETIRTSLDLCSPYSLEGMPAFQDIIEDKYRYAKTRWHETKDSAGFKKYHNRNFYVLGWCGQAAALGYALPVLKDGLDAPETLSMAQKSLDFLSSAEFYDGGFHTWYDYKKKKWSRHEPLSQGQGMLNVANAVRVGEKKSLDTKRWKAFLRKACDFHSRRILKEDWNPKSTDEAFFIAPLCEGYRIFGIDIHREAAEKAGQIYADRHVSMREPYWGGTLDASCEDKEGAFAALQGFLALYELTGESRYLQWAGHALDVVLTYVVIWDIDLPPGRLRDHNFKTRGWTVVSPQNQHIDVYGVLIAPLVYRMGELLERDELKRLAILMFRSCGQLIDPYGSQGEQPQHTNYTQGGKADDIFALRGGYVEDWTVFWITAHFLNAAAQFRELGVSIWD